jgi:hypothetical protein
MTEHRLMLGVELLAQCIEPAVAQRSVAGRHGDLVTLPRIAHVERALDADLLLLEAVGMQLVDGGALQPFEHGVDVPQGELVERRHARLNVVVLDVGHDQPDRGIDAGVKRHDHPGHSQFTCNTSGMHRPGAAEGE